MRRQRLIHNLENKFALNRKMTGVEQYEDMFKEITRKLYGDEAGNGIYPSNIQIAQLAHQKEAPPEGGERSFTTLVSDQRMTLEYDGVLTDPINNFKPDDHQLNTAFGLAALGFPPPSISFPVTSSNKSNLNTQTWVTQQSQQGNVQSHQTLQNTFQHHQQSNIVQSNVVEEILPWNQNKLPIPTTYVSSQKLFKVKTKQEPISSELHLSANPMTGNINSSNSQTINVLNTLNSINSLNTTPTPAVQSPVVKTEANNLGQVVKRYNCSSCPYSTDRRDLFTRHENIHKDEKPFHCYACLKQFNRADHVKKHFMRMHRELAYDINKTRRYPPKTNNNNSSTVTNNNANIANIASPPITSNFFSQPQSIQQAAQSIQQVQSTTITVPNTSFSNSQQSQINSQQQIIEQVVQNAAREVNQHNQQVQTISNIITNINIKHEKIDKSSMSKKKCDKKFTCCYCPWSGADNWGLKRHLNTHTKPYICLLCDYKAARSERLATHVFKVHNKKACNKCNYFADDQNQLVAHQMESHQNEARPPRVTSNIQNNNILTNHSVNNNIVTSTGSTGNNSNVLRTLTTNVSLPNIQTINTSHAFNSLNQSSLNNAATSIYSTTANSNLVEQLNQHLNSNNWRTTLNSTNHLTNITNSNNIISNLNLASRTTTLAPSVTNNVNISTTATILKRKTGAERLFAYMEADDSDSEEDYARQLQLQALSRNTSSVAQDFHKAGDCKPNNSYCKPSESDDLVRAINIIGRNNNITLKTTSNPILSPAQYNKSRYKSLSSDKENNKMELKKQLEFLREQQQAFLSTLGVPAHEKSKAVTEINEIFEKLYNNSIGIFSTPPSSPKSPNMDMETQVSAIPEFLRNNKDITWSVMNQKSPKSVLENLLSNPKRNKSSITIEKLESKAAKTMDFSDVKRGRKQSQPRKIHSTQDEAEVAPKFVLSNLRDKHMISLITKQKCCYLCKQTCDKNSYYTTSSLILHKIWRHSKLTLKCKQCKKKFNRVYKLKLHQKLRH